MNAHKPVLLQEVIAIFNPRPGRIYIDATINGGGHSAAIAERIGPRGILVGVDLDCDLIEAAKFKIKKSKLKIKFIPLCENYANLKVIVEEHKLGGVDGILFDLGFSSHHIEKSGRGFSFRKNEPLDMRYNTKDNELTAEKIINTWSREAIENLLQNYGEEQFARSIARGILRERNSKKIAATGELAKIVEQNVPAWYLKRRIHPATKTFQALRIAVNRELENLEKVLPQAVELLKPGGRLIIISFQSLEDRIAKNFFKQKEKEGVLKVLTPKPLISSLQEVKDNPRARPAKLRAAEKL